MTAQLLDGKALAATIKADLTVRVQALLAQGITPGLGTVLVGDDPGSKAYVAGKHRDCAQVGIASLQVELPASVSEAELEAEIARLNADPTCTGYIVQLPLPGGLDENRALGLIDPGKDADGLHPVNLGKLVLGRAGAAAVHPARHRRAAAPQRGRAERRRGLHRRPRHHGRPTAGAAADPQERERHRHAVPHRHRRHRRSHPDRRHRGRRGRAPRTDHRRHDQARSGLRRRRHHPHRGRAGR